ncbi:MAG: hypothetical protein GWO16_15765, partial [Gammaproteobacteria bacterium]|nr:hypothetical protein [Gammaproteobacteria bacterium]NIR99299.1 hypothetical protein [Gammaproteobacteria bacterium]NIT64972.1 hypothetical protein [Gammaproteobacteria bacterium]NIV21989.1 hypothetical protein [Gammaproteobacteria bacterium]NIY33551.1 hypothetical protein [Gammaproteobacteria bacterium]
RHVVRMDGESPHLLSYEALISGNDPRGVQAHDWQADDLAHLCYTG